MNYEKGFSKRPSIISENPPGVVARKKNSIYSAWLTTVTEH